MTGRWAIDLVGREGGMMAGRRQASVQDAVKPFFVFGFGISLFISCRIMVSGVRATSAEILLYLSTCLFSPVLLWIFHVIRQAHQYTTFDAHRVDELTAISDRLKRGIM